MRAGIGPLLILLAAAVPIHAAETPLVIKTERAELLYRPEVSNHLNAVEDCYFVLSLTISPAGRVTTVEVAERGYASRRLLESAIDYVKLYRFKPATRDGVPVEFRVQQPFTVSTGANDRISAEFRKQSQKVVDLLNAGDHAGGRHHAEWMLSEVVRNSLEYAGLQGALAQTYSGIGEHHRALEALRSVTRRVPVAPLLDPRQPPPANDPKYYVVADRDYMANLIELKLRTATRLGFLAEALKSQYELAGLIELEPANPFALLADQLRSTLEDNAPLVSSIRINDSGLWTHQLYRHSFTLRRVQATVTKIILSCENESRELAYGEDLEWTVPKSWQNCSVSVQANAGGSLDIVEFGDG